MINLVCKFKKINLCNKHKHVTVYKLFAKVMSKLYVHKIRAKVLMKQVEKYCE